MEDRQKAGELLNSMGFVTERKSYKRIAIKYKQIICEIILLFFTYSGLNKIFYFVANNKVCPSKAFASRFNVKFSNLVAVIVAFM